MKGESKIHISDSVPLNSTGVTKVYVNTVNNKKVHSFEGPEIHVQKESSDATDIDLHLKTTLSIASSAKIRLLFMVNFMLCALCFLIVGVISFYYWNEMTTVRQQIDLIKSQMSVGHQSILVSESRSPYRLHESLDSSQGMETRNPVIGMSASNIINQGQYGTMEPNKTQDPKTEFNSTILLNRDLFTVQFNGNAKEINLGKDFQIGPWVLDKEVSSQNSNTKIELSDDSKYVTIKEDGLYMIYAQVVYLSYKPNCFLIWAKHYGEPSKLISSCYTGDDSSNRPLSRAQMSCSTQAIARLKKDDTVLMVQREDSRTLWLRPGYTFFGFVKLN